MGILIVAHQYLIDWSTRYLTHVKNRFTEKTFKEKKAVFSRFFKKVSPDLPAEDVNPGMVMDYLEYRKATQSGNASNKDRKNLLAAWTWACKYVNGFPCTNVNPFLTEKMPEDRHPRYVPPVKDFWKVFDLTQGADRMMLETFLYTAARRNEIFSLKWTDVHFDTGEISLWTRKTLDGSWREDRLPMTDNLMNNLLSHKQNASNHLVFPNPQTGAPYVDRRRWLKDLCKQADVQYFGLHAIRHLTPSILCNSGVPSKVVQAIMRHQKLSTTERYLHRLSDVKFALRLLDGGRTGASEGASVATKAKREVAHLS